MQVVRFPDPLADWSQAGTLSSMQDYCIAGARFNAEDSTFSGERLCNRVQLHCTVVRVLLTSSSSTLHFCRKCVKRGNELERRGGNLTPPVHQSQGSLSLPFSRRRVGIRQGGSQA